MDEIKALRLLIIKISSKLKQQPTVDAAALSALAKVVDSYHALIQTDDDTEGMLAPLKHSLHPADHYQ